MGVITTRNRKRKPIAIRKTGHPAAFRKIRCPKKCPGYAVASNLDPSVYTCERCGSQFRIS